MFKNFLLLAFYLKIKNNINVICIYFILKNASRSIMKWKWFVRFQKRKINKFFFIVWAILNKIIPSQRYCYNHFSFKIMTNKNENS